MRSRVRLAVAVLVNCANDHKLPPIHSESVPRSRSKAIPLSYAEKRKCYALLMGLRD